MRTLVVFGPNLQTVERLKPADLRNDPARADDHRTTQPRRTQPDHHQRLDHRVGERGDDDQPAEDDDAVDGVRLRHQRGVQRVRDLRDHLEADEGGEHEDRYLGHQVHG